MTALASDYQRCSKVHVPQLLSVPVNAGSAIYAGAIVCREAATALGIPGADTASIVPLGVAVEGLDNTSGADGAFTDGDEGARCVRVDQVGEYEFAVEGGTPLPGNPAYIYDDNTVHADAGVTNNDIVIGEFTRPGPNGGWFVDISKRA